MKVPPELPVTPIPPQTEIEKVPRPLNAQLLEESRERATAAEEDEDRLEISAEARAFHEARHVVRDALSADRVDPDEVADRAFDTIRDSLYPEFRAERGRTPEAVDAFGEQVRRGIERGGEESRARPRPEGAGFEAQRTRAVERLQGALVSFVDAERLVATNDPPASS